jgi:hypothetical protein
MHDPAILLREENVISLRTAFVRDDGDVVSFRLRLASIPRPIGRSWWAPKDFEWVSQDSAWLYRHLRSPEQEEALMRIWPSTFQHGVKPLVFTAPPRFKLVWTGSGQGVALYLNGEPWAFIDERTHEGYSKGVLDPASGQPWNQSLFERIFASETG